MCKDPAANKSGSALENLIHNFHKEKQCLCFSLIKSISQFNANSPDNISDVLEIFGFCGRLNCCCS